MLSIYALLICTGGAVFSINCVFVLRIDKTIKVVTNLIQYSINLFNQIQYGTGFRLFFFYSEQNIV